MLLPLRPPCRSLLGPDLSGSAMTFCTHMRPLAKDFTSMSWRSSPPGVKSNGIRPIQLSFASAYFGM